MTSETGQKVAYFFCFVVVSVAVVGFFTGLQSPMNPALTVKRSRPIQLHASARSNSNPTASDVALATGYADMANVTRQKSAVWPTNLADLKSNIDPLAVFTITPEEKTFALAMRERNRAFNGAPPTIPHPIDQLSTQTCMACHGEGIKTQTLRASKMSHQFLANCTQCHAEGDPQHMPASLFRLIRGEKTVSSVTRRRLG